MGVVQEVQQIFSRIPSKEYAKMIKETWIQCIEECVVVDRQYFEKNCWKGVVSESEDECYARINVILLNSVFLFFSKGRQNCLSSNGYISSRVFQRSFDE